MSSGMSGVNSTTAMMLGNPVISSTAKMSKSSVGRAVHDNATLGYSRALGAALIGGGPNASGNEMARKQPSSAAMGDSVSASGSDMRSRVTSGQQGEITGG